MPDDGPPNEQTAPGDQHSTAQSPTADAAAAATSPAIPRSIGRYRIKQIIDSGGMGTVYLAVQEQPRRTVALKVMKHGIASKSALRRFEFESQILARLKHSCIAEVYDAGTHDDGTGGVPYFAMEYIPNAKTVTEYAKGSSLSTRERLQLFAKVCDGVHHGHQKGVIHRDLKPGNILIDADGQPKIIDFGVARATDSDLAITTLQTDIGQLIGTLQYMSPEQCEADPHDIDTRSDVYALGVVLYELICEQLPYDVSKVAIHEAARVIREETPSRPSTINRTLRGDVETITLKAMEKDRRRRYRSAIDLSDDIQRYLDSQPIEARPPSAIYQFHRFVDRNKTVVVAAGLLVAALLAGGIGTTIGLFRAVEAEQRALNEKAIAEAVNDFLNEDLLAAVAPSAEKGKGKDVLMRDVLDEAAKRIEEALAVGGRFGDKPLVEASIRQTLGDTYTKLGKLPTAEPHLERARELRRRVLGEEHPDTLKAVSSLASLYHEQGRYDEAEPLYLQTLEIRKRVLGEEHPDTLSSMNNVAVLHTDQGRYDEAGPLYLETLTIHRRIFGEEHPQTLKSMNNLALHYWNQGRHDEAEPLYLRTLQIKTRIQGKEHPDTLLSLKNLASLYHRQGRYDEAEPLYLEAVEIHNRVQGEEHPDTLRAVHDLASLYHELGRYDEAGPLYVKTVGAFKRVLGEEHPKTLVSMSNLALLYRNQGRDDEAEPLYLETLEIQKRVLGGQHPNTLLSMNNLAELYHHEERYDDAAALFEETVAGARRAWPERHWITGAILGYYGNTLIELQRYEDAETNLLEAHNIILAGLGPDHERTNEQIGSLAKLYDAWGKPEKAAEWRAKLPVEQEAVASDQPATADEKQDE